MISVMEGERRIFERSEPEDDVVEGFLDVGNDDVGADAFEDVGHDGVDGAPEDAVDQFVGVWRDGFAGVDAGLVDEFEDDGFDGSFEFGIFAKAVPFGGDGFFLGLFMDEPTVDAGAHGDSEEELGEFGLEDFAAEVVEEEGVDDFVELVGAMLGDVGGGDGAEAEVEASEDVCV